MPIIRGRAIPEVESAGPAKRAIDVLLWLPQVGVVDLQQLDDLQVARTYLHSMPWPVCDIRMLVPDHFADLQRALLRLRIDFQAVPPAPLGEAKAALSKIGAPADMQACASTALACDADIVVSNDSTWFPYIEEFAHLHLLLADSGVLKRQCEIFVRGHNVPWAFGHPVANGPWTAFYQLSEPRTFVDGLDFLHFASGKTFSSTDSFECARSLVHNRLANLCFTRDRLLFYEQQQAVAKRRGWERQEFLFELAYHLDFYYLLLYGGFDHVAKALNGFLRLGLKDKHVGARYPEFLKTLQTQAPEIYAIFNEPKTVGFLKRIAALRHLTAHSGAITPGKIYLKPDVEPTTGELDAEISRSGLDRVLAWLPRPVGDSFRQTLRLKAKLARSELWADGMVLIELNGKYCWIKPIVDTCWNFDTFHRFLVRTLTALRARLA